jgi:hypothetical protein
MYKSLGWAKALSLSSGCLFLDEITNVQRLDVQSVMLKIMLEKLVGFIKLNDDVQVIAAGNKSGKLVTTLPEPLLAGRVVKLDIKPPTLQEWTEYMNETFGDYDRRVVIFLKKLSEKFIEEINEEEAEKYSVFATPRSWTKLALVSHKLDKSVLEAVSRGLVGESATLFLSFLDVRVPELKELKENLELWKKFTVDQKYFMSLELCSVDDKVLFKEFGDVMTMLAKEDREFLMLTFMMMNKDKRKKIAMEAKLKYPDVFNVLLNSSLLVVRMEKGGQYD